MFETLWALCLCGPWQNTISRKLRTLEKLSLELHRYAQSKDPWPQNRCHASKIRSERVGLHQDRARVERIEQRQLRAHVNPCATKALRQCHVELIDSVVGPLPGSFSRTLTDA